MNAAQRAADAEPTPQQRRWMLMLGLTFGASILCFLSLCGLYCYYGYASPTLAEERSGRVYPFFDKIHGNYVYLTKSQYYGASSLAWLGMSCFLGYIIVHQRLKHLVGRSPKDNNADTSRD
jgi:hypothetical protein